MKILLVLLMVVLVGGCSTAEKALEVSAEREANLNNARLASKSIDSAERITLAKIPACRIEAAENQTITMGGVKVFECHGGVFVTSGDSNEIQARPNRFADFMMTQGNNVFGFMTMCLVFGACGLGGTSALPSVGPSPENILIPTQVIEQPTVIFAP